MPVEVREHEALSFIRTLYKKALKHEVEWCIPEDNWVGVKLITLDFQFGVTDIYARVELRDKEGQVEHVCVITKLGDPEAYGLAEALMTVAREQIADKEQDNG